MNIQNKNKNSYGKLIFKEPDKVLIKRKKKIKIYNLIIISILLIANLLGIYFLIIDWNFIFLVMVISFFITSFTMLYALLNVSEKFKDSRLEIFEKGFKHLMKPEKKIILFSDIISWRYNKSFEIYELKLKNKTEKVFLDNKNTKKEFQKALNKYCVDSK